MNRPPDNKRLLADVLSEAAPADFREALLGETLHLVRRRRQWRQVRRIGGALTVLTLLGVLVFRNLPNHPTAPTRVTKVAEKSYELVLTQPLPVGAIVTTRPLNTEQFVASATTVAVIQTATSRGFRVITDEELLALVAPRPAALIRLGPDSERLIFVNPEDAQGFPLN